MMVNCWEKLCGVGELSFIVIVTGYDPAVVGVPLITPVLELSDKPGGKLPDVWPPNIVTGALQA
jgi:hypothetical protein